jgi:hypothetical protein
LELKNGVTLFLKHQLISSTKKHIFIWRRRHKLWKGLIKQQQWFYQQRGLPFKQKYFSSHYFLVCFVFSSKVSSNYTFFAFNLFRRSVNEPERANKTLSFQHFHLDSMTCNFGRRFTSEILFGAKIFFP